MILVVKGRNYKRLAVKAFSVIGLIVMFFLYYNHMSDKFKSQNNSLVKKLNIKEDNKQIKLSKKIEKLIYKEAEMAVDLLGQNNVQSIRIAKNRLFLVCDYNTDLEPLLVRYGVKALVKSSLKDIKIAIDLKFIVESRYEK
jgi:hypothetical protein